MLFSSFVYFAAVEFQRLSDRLYDLDNTDVFTHDEIVEMSSQWYDDFIKKFKEKNEK